MPGDTTRKDNLKETSDDKAASGSNPLILVLAGATALLIAAIAIFAVVNASGGGESAGSGGGAAQNFTPNDEGLIPSGDKVPAFTAETAGGEKVSLTDKGGKNATMLVFFATWCPHCQDEAPVMSELESQYDDLRVVMVGIDGEEDAKKVQAFADEYEIESPAVYEPQLGASYGVSGYPTVYVLDGEDRVVGATAGEAPRAVFESWIQSAL